MGNTKTCNEPYLAACSKVCWSKTTIFSQNLRQSTSSVRTTLHGLLSLLFWWGSVLDIHKTNRIKTHMPQFPNWCCCSVAKLCLTLWDPMDCSTSGFPVLHHLPEFAQIHIHWTDNAIQPSHPLSLSSPLAFNISQHQGLFQWVGSLHQVANVLELQPQHQSFQWIFSVDFL